jgi:hypothetical protein
MRKFLITASALAAAGAVAVTAAVAQDPPTKLTVDPPKVVPNKAGTPSKPQGVSLTVSMHWDTPEDAERPIVQTFDVLFPQGSKYNGDKFPSCSQTTMARNRGTANCPKGSIMGQGSGVAYADDVFTRPQITVVNGGKDKVYFFTVLSNPARVQAPVLGKITKLGTRGKYAYKLHVEVPKVLQVVAGVPIQLKDLKVTGNSKKTLWLSTIGCPKDKKWPYSVTTGLSTGGAATYESTTPCT